MDGIPDILIPRNSHIPGAVVIRCATARIEGGTHFMPEDHPEIIAEGINQLVAEAASSETTAGAIALKGGCCD